MDNKQYTSKLKGFTIIEILMGIVVIGILVGIVTVSFTGITKQTRQAALENALIDTAGKARAYKNKNGVYPTNINDIDAMSSPDIELALVSVSSKSFCVSAVGAGGVSFNITSDSGTITEGGCPFIAGGHIQTATKDTCPPSRTLAVDARDNHTYWIQKLADGNCWMLTNLAYAGGGTNTYGDVINQGTGAPGTPKGTLSNGTADTASTYTEAKYYISPSANPTTDPTPPSTATDGGENTSTRQFGYLYNWCAAMGGQNTAACAEATTPTPIPTINICPAGWRLPTGGSGGEFTALNTAINGGSTSSDAGLLSNGLFQRSGYWYYGFSHQGLIGSYWSSTQYSATGARYLYFNSTSVYPPNSSGKYIARAVRCIAK